MKRALILAVLILLALPSVALGWQPLHLEGQCNQSDDVDWIASTTHAEADMTVEFSSTSDFAVVLDRFDLFPVPGGYATDPLAAGPVMYVRWFADPRIVTRGEVQPCPTPTPEPSSTPTATPSADPTPVPTPTSTPSASSTATPTTTPSGTPSPTHTPTVTLPPTSTETTPGSNSLLGPLLLLAMIVGFAVSWMKVRRS
jgi:hypothetical protein